MAVIDALWNMFGNRDEGNKAARAKATVLRVDEDGTVWVHIEGGVTETPVYSTTADVQQGDVVTVRVEGGKAYVDGSTSNPSVGVRRIVEAVEPVAKAADAAKGLAAAANAASEAAQRIATEAQEAAQAVSQYFWQRSEDTQADGAGTGAFVTEETQEDFLEAVAKGFPDLSDSHPHHNLLMNSLGILLRTGLRNLVSITRSAIAFYDGVGNAAANVVARFGKDGAQIGKSGGQHATIDSSGFSTYDGSMRTSLIGNGTIDIGSSGTGGLRFDSTYGLRMRGKSGGVMFEISEVPHSTVGGDVLYGFRLRNAANQSFISMYPDKDDTTESELDVDMRRMTAHVKDEFAVYTYDGGYTQTFRVSHRQAEVITNLLVSDYGSDTTALLEVKHTNGGDARIRVTDRDASEPSTTTLVIGSSFIGFETSNRSARAIRFFQSGDQYGDAIVIGDGGMFVAGAGESAENLYNAKRAAGASAGDENAYLSADGAVYIVPNCNTIANRVEYYFNSAGLYMLNKSIFDAASIEMRPSSATSNNGGYIDFHYNQSTANYTSRIIEAASGRLDVDAHLRVRGSHAFQNLTTRFKQSAAPSAITYMQVVEALDSNGDTIGHDEYSIGTSRQIAHNFAAVRQKTNDSTWSWYQCSMTVAVDGTVSYSIANPAAFRSAIGAQASGSYAAKTWTQKGTSTTANAMTYSLSGCSEVMFAAISGTSYLGSVVLPIGLLHASTARQVYLTGSYNGGTASSISGRAFALTATTTKATPAIRKVDGVDATVTWYCYGR